MSEICLKSTVTQTTLLAQKGKKHQNNDWNLLKVNNKDTITTSWHRSGDFTFIFKQILTHCFGVPPADFKQTNVNWGGRVTFKCTSETTNTLD